MFKYSDQPPGGLSRTYFKIIYISNALPRCSATVPFFFGGGCLGGGISVSVISAGLGGVGDLGRPRRVSAVSAVSVVSAGLCGVGGLGGLVGGVTNANFFSIFFPRGAGKRGPKASRGGRHYREFSPTKSIQKQPNRMPKPLKTIPKGCKNLLKTSPGRPSEGFEAHLGPE